MSFADIIQKELKKSENNEQVEFPKRKHPYVQLGKNTSFYGRILPATLDKKQGGFPFYRYTMTFIGYKDKSKSWKPAAVTLDTKENGEKFYDIINAVNEYNRSVSDEQKIHLNPVSSYFSSIQNKYEFVGVPVNEETNQMETTEQGGLKLENVGISVSAYRNILKALQNPKLTVMGQPFEDPDMKFITMSETIPVTIEYDGDTSYNVTGREIIKLPALNFELNKQGQDGLPLYYDDPETIHKPLKQVAPGFYDFLVETAITTMEQQSKGVLKGSDFGVGQTTVQVEKNPYANDDPFAANRNPEPAAQESQETVAPTNPVETPQPSIDSNAPSVSPEPDFAPAMENNVPSPKAPGMSPEPPKNENEPQDDVFVPSADLNDVLNNNGNLF